MIKTIVLLPLLAMTAAFAQTDETAPIHRHEVGVDATLFLRQFFTRQDADAAFLFPTSPYLFSYRYKTRCFNLRFGAGGSFSESEYPASWFGSLPDEIYKRMRSSLDLRVGAEIFQQVGPRWQVFQGLDIRAHWARDNNGFTFSNAGYRNARDMRTEELGLAPLFGVRFRVTPRFSILTEMSVALAWGESNVSEVRTPLTEEQPPVEDETSRTRHFNTVYQPPLFVAAVFDL